MDWIGIDVSCEHPYWTGLDWIGFRKMVLCPTRGSEGEGLEGQVRVSARVDDERFLQPAQTVQHDESRRQSRLERIRRCDATALQTQVYYKSTLRGPTPGLLRLHREAQRHHHHHISLLYRKNCIQSILCCISRR